MAEKIVDGSTPEYSMGYSDEFQQLLKRRSAETTAAHLIPLLKPGMRVLDFGCGPGTISVGLAKVVAPGELHGIDLEESQVKLARAAAAAGGHDNATFHVANATKLPFEDDSFDAAHCNAVLNHIPDTQTALAEVKRVLKPGGIMFSRDWISGANIWFPQPGTLGSAFDLFGALVEASDGHPYMGKELKNEFRLAGFTDIVTSVSYETYSSSEDVEFFHGWAVNYISRIAERVIELGLGAQSDIDGYLASLDEWKSHPGSFAGNPWGQAIGHKP
ncbi:MAG: methyltransferase domain-containing protein [Chloroflexi bacterium]|nr:methyltransferase domain-containing protein [Chloroflexota bacterium]